MTLERSVAEFFTSVEEKIGTADILINNVELDPKRFKDLDEESWNYFLMLTSMVSIGLLKILLTN